MHYTPDDTRYDNMTYIRCGVSGLKLPALSLGLWHNFGRADSYEVSAAIARKAFDLGITHFDLANNYGPPPGGAEETFGRILKDDFASHRDELIISTKAGYTMWPGPYGDWGSRKYLISSLDQSLLRLGLDYVDIFYHHRPDPETPLEETMAALDHIVRQGKALYIGISNYSADETKKAIRILRDLGTPLLIHQGRYSMLNRQPEEGLLDHLERDGVGFIAFSPLAQGLLTERYLEGIPQDSRAAKTTSPFLKRDDITPGMSVKIRTLHNMALERNQTLAQMALSWVYRNPGVTSVLVGASRPEQLEDSAGFLRNLEFSKEELLRIERILSRTEE